MPTCADLPSEQKLGVEMFTVTIDRQRQLVATTLSGFLSMDEVPAFYAAEQDAARSLEVQPSGHLLLIDASNYDPQSQEVVVELRRMIDLRPLRARRAAIVISQALARMQMRRLVEGATDVEIFASLDEAEAWLMSASADVG